MELLSVNVSLPIAVEHEGKVIETSIFKKPVTGPVAVSRSHLEGDGQADLKNHGGEDKAVYAYSFDHYAFWCETLDKEEITYGQFGENLTISGLDESKSCIGDQLEIGSALFAITQPRVPCFKLGIQFDDKKMPGLFIQFALTGFYLKVLREGVVEAENAVILVQKRHECVPVKALFEAYYQHETKKNMEMFHRALDIPELSGEWREKLEERVQRG